MKYVIVRGVNGPIVCNRIYANANTAMRAIKRLENTGFFNLLYRAI